MLQDWSFCSELDDTAGGGWEWDVRKSKLYGTGVMGSYYGSLAYGNLDWELQSVQQYGEGYGKGTAEYFWKWAVELEGKVFDSVGLENFVWAVPAPVCAMRCINDSPYVRKDIEETEKGGVEAKKQNVQFRASRTV